MSYLLWEGPSLLDGKPIFVAAACVETPSQNTKTGPMVQVYVMRSDINPIEAVHTGADQSICGNCAHRGDGTGRERTCYVTLMHGPLIVFKQYQAGKLKKLPKGLFRNRAVRLGAYGDMAAVPSEVTTGIAKAALFTTGYTHQWMTCDPELSRYLMASCDTEEQRIQAKSLGWSTFRVKAVDQTKARGETLCPASEEAGKKLTCFSCTKCSGNTARDVVINIHGSGKKHFILKQEAA